jgi:hypothetical protein
MSRTFTGYRITQTGGQYSGEVGTRISLERWGENVGPLVGYDEPIPLTLADGVEPGYSQLEERLLWRADEQRGMTLDEAQHAGWVVVHRTVIPEGWDPEADEREWQQLREEMA